MVVLEKKQEYCLEKEVMTEDTLKLSFMITGAGEEGSIYTVLKGPHSINYYENIQNENKYKDKDEFSLKVNYSGFYSLCFLSKLETAVVSFEFITMLESGYLISVAKDQVFEEMYRNVTVISSLFAEIEKNLKFYVERRDIHSRLISDIINLIQKLTFSKVFIIVLFAALQVYIIRRFFPSQKSESKFKVSEKDQTVFL